MSYFGELRKLLGHRPLLMTGATVLLVDDQNRLLLLKRSDNQCWGPPGGALELNETIEEAAKRETQEETGLEIGEMEFFGIFSGPEQYYRFPNGDEIHIVAIAYVSRNSCETIRLSDEHTDWGCFPLNDLPVPLSPPIVPILRKFALDFHGEIGLP